MWPRKRASLRAGVGRAEVRGQLVNHLYREGGREGVGPVQAGDRSVCGEPAGISDECGSGDGRASGWSVGRVDVRYKSAPTEIGKADVKASDQSKPVTAQFAEGLLEHPMSVAQETGEPLGGASVELKSKDKPAITVIVKSDVKAPGESKPVTARPAEGLPEHPMSVAQKTVSNSVLRYCFVLSEKYGSGTIQSPCVLIAINEGYGGRS